MKDSEQLNTWRELQTRELQRYRESYDETGSYLGCFSVAERRDALDLKDHIADRCDNCLDVGSGILPRPVYMPEDVKFFGIDPFFGEHKREYGFAQAIGEYLPFPGNAFDCVSFMSTLDHQIFPLISLREAYRVMIDRGFIFIWGNFYADGSKMYRVWKEKKVGATVDNNHQYAFTINDAKELLKKAKFSYVDCIFIRRGRFRTYLIIGQK